MSKSSEPFTIGVEEEYQIVSATTRELRPRAGRIMADAKDAVGDDVTNELYLSQIEIGTPVCHDLAEARAELTRLRAGVIAAAEQHGYRIAAAGTHPFSLWEDQTLTPKSRYYGLAADYQQIVREQVIFGCHVHVGFTDREAAIQVMNRVRPWLPVFIALSANSPFWQGIDTGYASYRTEMFGRFPMSGVPQVFESRAEFDDVVASLVSAGMIEDGSKIYWDARPSSHVETLEFRAADVCPTIDEAVMVAGLCRGLAKRCHDDHVAGARIDHARPELMQAAKWFASRYGLSGELIDTEQRRSVPAAELVEKLLAFVKPALKDLGEWGEVSKLVRGVLENGNGAKRQRIAFARSNKFEDVVDMIVAETSAGV